jgi:hypothetical protein
VTSDSAGTTIWADADNPAFETFVAYITNGTPDSLAQFLQLGAGVGGVGVSEADFFSRQAGPSGVDLYGYVIHAIGFKVDEASFDSPGSDPNGNGIWTDVTIRGRFLFVGTIAREGCKGEGWRILRDPDGAHFKNQGDRVAFANPGT